MPFISRRPEVKSNNKKKPPPRPPPPKFSKYKSKSSYNLHQQTDNLIEWSPPDSPKVKNRNFGGSVSSSFSSSTSSLGSSKKSLEYEFPFSNHVWPINTGSATNKYVKQSNNSNTLVSTYQSTATTSYISTDIFQQQNSTKVNNPPLFGPTIIRPYSGRSRAFRDQNNHDSDPPSPTLPMPSVPPPSPPKDVSNVNVAYGIAIYDYQGTDPKDLSFQVNDVVILMRKINNDWYYGKVMDKEGMFPSNFVDVQVPLVENDKTVMALYEFTPQMPEDLAIRPGQIIKVIKKINEEWLYGESNGQYGQFPSNFIDRMPNL